MITLKTLINRRVTIKFCSNSKGIRSFYFVMVKGVMTIGISLQCKEQLE